MWLFATSWTVTRQAPLSMEFSRREYWNWLPFPTPENLSNPGVEPTSLESPALAGRIFTTAPPRSLLRWPKSLSFSITYGIQLSPIHMNVHSSFELSKVPVYVLSDVSSIRRANHSLPSVSYCWRPFSSTISHLLSLLRQAGTLLACSLHASPCVPSVVLYYCTFQGTVLQDEEYFIFCVYVLFMWTVL